MAKRIDIKTKGWSDYELIDSGENQKLEKFGGVLLYRPETEAVWEKKTPDIWKDSKAFFKWSAGKGSWVHKKEFGKSWQMKWNNISIILKLTAFKHLGIFPEQEANWVWLKESVSKLKEPEVLNLFAYTGISSLVMAEAGAKVTHVDASKQSITWSEENRNASKIDKNKIRYILDDALVFVKREVRRGKKYDGIVLDPPAFGRGAKGEVWKIEESLSPLMKSLKELLKDDKGSFFLLNGYSAGYSPESFKQLVQSYFEAPQMEYGEMHIEEKASGRVVPAGIYTRFRR